MPGYLTAVSGVVLTVPQAAEHPDGWFLGGIVLTQDEILRWIVGHSGDQITLASQVLGLSEHAAAAGWGRSWDMYWGGLPITLYPGCDLSLETCWGKFGNGLNHGGHPWFPLRNPFDGQSLV